MVKFQTIDIVKVIWALMGRRSASQSCVATRNQGASWSRQPRPLGLPLNPLECGPAETTERGIMAAGQPANKGFKGLDHGVGHFRPLSITRQRHVLAYHFIARRHEGLCQVFWQFLSPQPIEFSLLTNAFYFNILQEKQENQLVIQIDILDLLKNKLKAVLEE